MNKSIDDWQKNIWSQPWGNGEKSKCSLDSLANMFTQVNSYRRIGVKTYDDTQTFIKSQRALKICLKFISNNIPIYSFREIDLCY